MLQTILKQVVLGGLTIFIYSKKILMPVMSQASWSNQKKKIDRDLVELILAERSKK